MTSCKKFIEDLKSRLEFCVYKNSCISPEIKIKELSQKVSECTKREEYKCLSNLYKYTKQDLEIARHQLNLLEKSVDVQVNYLNKKKQTLKIVDCKRRLYKLFYDFEICYWDVRECPKDTIEFEKEVQSLMKECDVSFYPYVLKTKISSLNDFVEYSHIPTVVKSLERLIRRKEVAEEIEGLEAYIKLCNER